VRNLDEAVAFTLRETGLPAWLLGDFPATLASGGARLSEAEQAAFRSIGSAAASGGTGLRELVDLYLSLARRALPELPAVTETVAAGDAAGVRHAAAEALRHTEEAVAALTEGYAVARGHAAQLAESLRREFIDDLLTGGVAEGPLQDRAARLGHRMAGERMVLVLAGQRALADYGPVMRQVEYALSGRLGAADQLVAAREGQLACIVPVGDAVGARAGAEELAAVVLEQANTLEPAGAWRVAVSRPRTGATGVRAGWLEAAETLALATALGLQPGVVPATDLGGYRLLLHDRAAVAELVAEVFGPLATARGGAAPLVATLRAVFAAGGNVAAAARSLHLSVRATIYRLQRVERLTGYRLADPAHRFTLQAAAIGSLLHE
jgi:hypothetical protein